MSDTTDILECTCGGGVPVLKYFRPYSWLTCNKCRKCTSVHMDHFKEKDGIENTVKEWNNMITEAKNV